MKRLAPILMLGLAILPGVFTFVGEGSYARLLAVKKSLNAQERHNQELGEKIKTLKDRVYGLSHDQRQLEKAARNELGMAKPDELIIVFDRDGGPELDD
jgi:cell division protein FtsB